MRLTEKANILVQGLLPLLAVEDVEERLILIDLLLVVKRILKGIIAIYLSHC